MRAFGNLLDVASFICLARHVAGTCGANGRPIEIAAIHDVNGIAGRNGPEVIVRIQSKLTRWKL
jgi:hypothetical protein